ncbi:MAG: acetolactate synthase catalytic subunit [Streptosporangiaceae bacterium]
MRDCLPQPRSTTSEERARPATPSPSSDRRPTDVVIPARNIRQERKVLTTNTVADQVASILVHYGVDCIFGQSIPTELMLAAEQRGIRQLLYRTENAGGAMADGYARVSHRVGVVAAQNGPAATLLVPPLSEALAASVPVVALVQEVPRTRRHRNAFQELDHHGLFGGCSKAVVDVDCPERVEADLFRAFSIATQGRPGPVVVLLPRDVLSLPAVSQGTAGPNPGSYPLDRPRPDAEAVRQAAALLAEADHPLVVAGGGIHLSDAAPELADLQEAASLPVATTTMGKGAVSEDHELSAGVIGPFMGRASYNFGLQPFVADADVVLFAGTRTNENGTDTWRLFSDQARFIQLDIAAKEIGRNYHAMRLMGDAKAGLADLVAELRRCDLTKRRYRRPETVDRLANAHRQGRLAAQSLTRSDAVPIRPERIMAELDALLSPQDMVVADASYATVWAAAYLEARETGQRFISPRGLAGLGWGLPLALGAKAASPHSRVVCLEGDGGFAHCWQEMETAVRESLPVVIILFRNDILGFQQHGELHTYGQHTSATGFGPVDHVAIARACGVSGVRVESPTELGSALSAALAAPVPTLVEVMVDPAAFPPFTKWDNSPALAQLASVSEQVQ